MKDSWSLMTNWNYLFPPSRPSKNQLDSITELCKEIDPISNIAVLGSTVEFRDLLFELGFTNIYIFERNLEFYKSTKSIRIYNNYENLIEGDWLDTIEKYPNIFSLILSDLTSGNIPYEKRKKFYQDIENSLQNRGIFYDKVLTHSNVFLNSDYLIEKYKNLPLNWIEVNRFSCEMLFCSDLLRINEVVDTNLFYSLIESRTSNPRIEQFVKLSKIITPLNFIWYYGKLWQELKPEYCPNLKVINISEDVKQSPYFKRLKFFTLSKNS